MFVIYTVIQIFWVSKQIDGKNGQINELNEKNKSLSNEKINFENKLKASEQEFKILSENHEILMKQLDLYKENAEKVKYFDS